MYPGIHAKTDPAKPAVVMVGTGRTLTYGELDDNSAAFAAALHARGLRKGDVVALLSDNTPECFEVFWGVMRSGLYITPVNRNLSADEVAYIVNDSGAKALVVSAGVAELAAKAERVGGGEEQLRGDALALLDLLERGRVGWDRGDRQREPCCLGDVDHAVMRGTPRRLRVRGSPERGGLDVVEGPRRGGKSVRELCPGADA